VNGVLYLSMRYLAHHRVKTAILVTSIALIVFLPFGLRIIVAESAARLTERAEATPLLVGARGSALELVLSSLYFESDTPAVLPWSELERIEASGLAQAIPLYTRFRARGAPIVGTRLEYFDYRGLELADGRQMAWLGECVLGSAAARALSLSPGDALLSSPDTVFDLAGTYPLRMRVAGVLAPTGGPDDHAVFVDVKTAWIVEGRVHGHRDLAAPEASAAVLRRDGDTITANAAVVEYNEITAENLASFHFHGDLGSYPLTAVLAVPPDAKAGVLLRGRYELETQPSQIVAPVHVMNELLDTVFAVQGYVVLAMGVVGAATAAIAALVFLLSLRLRRREIETLVKLGGSRGRVAAVMVSEVVAVLLLAGLAAGALGLVASRFGGAAIRALLLS
jgi:putative ABC transport system permease protein